MRSTVPSQGRLFFAGAIVATTCMLFLFQNYSVNTNIVPDMVSQPVVSPIPDQLVPQCGSSKTLLAGCAKEESPSDFSISSWPADYEHLGPVLSFEIENSKVGSYMFATVVKDSDEDTYSNYIPNFTNQMRSLYQAITILSFAAMTLNSFKKLLI